MSQVPQFPSIVKENMQRFINALGDDDAALFFSPPQHTRSNDTEFPFRQSSDILYLCGWLQPEMALFIRPKSDNPIVMFVQPKNAKMEIWTGVRPGIEGAKSDFGADEAYSIHDLAKQLPHLLMGVKQLHYRFAETPDMDQLLIKAIARARKVGRANGISFTSTSI